MSNDLYVHRRRLLMLAGSGVAAAAMPSSASARMQVLNYDALQRDDIAVAVVQTDVGSSAAMTREIDRAISGGAKDLIVLPGVTAWPRDLAEAQSKAISLADQAALIDRARAHNVHIVFSALVKDAAWAGHVIPMSVLITRHGDIKTSWHPTAIEGAPFLTAIETVLDRFVDMYGAEAILPVHRTSVGNLGLLAVSGAPELYQALADKGAEMIVRSAAGPVAFWEGQACAGYNGCYTVVATPVGDAFVQASGSVIFGPRGEMLAAAGLGWTQTVAATVPLGRYRQHHRAPRRYANLINPTQTMA